MKHKVPLKSIRKLVNYLEHDEQKDYENHFGINGEVISTNKEAESHIYNHVRSVADWLESVGH
jgi:hypothetical protein